ncbi:MAG: lipopolysaccharide kinase InaA family protein [Planctomycetota bacterium]
MQRVVFADSWSQYFAESGLESFYDFFGYPAIETVGVNSKRNVVTFALGDGSGRRRFFMKRFFHPHFKDVFFARRNIGEFCSQGRFEWENARLLLDNGVGTYKPVCCSEQTRWGLETKSFCITEELRAECMTEFLRREWCHLERRAKERIMVSLAAFVRRIHALNIDMPDLYIWHIYVKEDGNSGEPDFAVIDMHRMSRNVRISSKKMKSLGRLHYSMIDDYFDDELRRLLIQSYAAEGWAGDVTALVAQIEKQSVAISAKRGQKQY